jgi:PAS domain S-box-containing protein
MNPVTLAPGEFLNAIVESSDDAIIGKALDGTILSWNGGAERLYGYAPHEILGQNITTIVPPDRRDELDGIYQKLERGERISHFETVRVHKNGTRLDVSITVSPVRDAEGRVVGASAIARDIGGRKRADAERARLREEIINAQDALLAELSTPLIPLRKGVVVMPLIGSINSQRAAQMIAKLLEGVRSKAARVAILDITGVPEVDTHVAAALVNAAKAVRLLGAEVVVTGIRGRLAQVLVSLGVDLSGVVTRRDLQGGIEYAVELVNSPAA